MLQLDPDAASVVRAKYCQAGPGFIAKNTATQDLGNYKYCYPGPRHDVGYKNTATQDLEIILDNIKYQ